MNVIVEKRLQALGDARRDLWAGFIQAAVRELRGVPAAMRWLLGVERRR